MAFADSAKIFIKAGRGGNGCRSFYRDKYYRHPQPDGGDGGKGADIILVADADTFTLLDFKFHQHFKAESGGHGSSKNQKGRNGSDLLVKAPVGTTVKDNATGFLLRDLKEAGQRVIVAQGGAGGRGNNRGREVRLPEAGEEKELFLELKLFADVGLIGLPNAGKSSLLTKVSHARPKIASYPFTTKEPILGVVQVGEFSFVMSDLPGLIQGAHEGRGLGDQFLKHVERTKILVHLVDMAAIEGRDPAEDLLAINKELELYDPAVIQKPQFIAANKMDLPEAKKHLAAFKKKIRKRIYPISALTGEGTDTLLKAIRQKLCKESLAKKSGA
jgi:GTPase